MIHFKEWLGITEMAIGKEVVDPYYLDDPEIGLDVSDRAKSEFYILFTILSAGKPSHQQARSLMYLLKMEEPEFGGGGGTPFEKVRNMAKKGTIVRNMSM